MTPPRRQRSAASARIARRFRDVVTDDRGVVAGIEVPAAIALLLIPIGLAMAAIAQWPERQTVARAAAHQAALLVAANPTPDSTEQAQRAVEQTAINHGLPAEDLQLQLEGDLRRGGAVTAQVTVQVPALTVPGLGSFAPFQWTATHTERVDDYRSIP